MEPAMILQSCLSSHEATQRCHMGIDIMSHLNLRPDQAVAVFTGCEVVLCTLCIGRKGMVCADKFVHKTNADTMIRTANLITSISPITIDNIETVAITVILTTDGIQKFGFNKCNQFLCGIVKKLLCRYVELIANGYVIETGRLRYGQCVGIAKICVNDMTPPAGYGKCTKGSKVHILQIESDVKHNQKLQFRNLKVGGLEQQYHYVCSSIEFTRHQQMIHQSVNQSWCIDVQKNFLLRGPSGCGKTTFVQTIARDFDAVLYIVKPVDIGASRLGEAEEKLNKIKEEILRFSQEGLCFVLFDDVEVFCPKEQQNKYGSAHHNLVVAQFIQVIDELTAQKDIIIFGATTHASSLFPSLRKPGHFDKELLFGIPGYEQRRSILQVFLEDLPIRDDCSLAELASTTPGFSGADLKLLINIAASTARNRQNTDKNGFYVCRKDFEIALHGIQPSSLKNSDFLAHFQPISWSDIGGLEDVKQQIIEAVELPLKHPDAFTRLGIPQPKGVLLYGPPGCAKTTLVKAAATSCHVTFLTVSCAQLYSPFLGDSEKRITEIFTQARAAAPCILFMDEIDALVGNRNSVHGDGGVQTRVLTTLLNEMDGIGLRLDEVTRDRRVLAEGHYHPDTPKVAIELVNNDEVLVILATNRPDVLDSALIRPGRIDKMIYVPPPDQQARESILKIYISKMAVAINLDIEKLVDLTDGFTGADLENLCREAALHALSTDGLNVPVVKQEHFEAVCSRLKPSVTNHDLALYNNFRIH